MTFHPLDANGRPLDEIALEGMQVCCIVGVYRAERHTPQPLRLGVSLYLDTRDAANRGGLKATVDYARLSGELRFLLENASFRLLEAAADALCRYILAPPTPDLHRAQVQAVTLRLAKPEALSGGTVAALAVHRRADEYRYAVEEKSFGRVDVIYEDGGAGIYRLRLKPGGAIATHEHREMEESELVLGSGLWLQGAPVAAGTGFRWPKGFPHRYDNPSAHEQTVLCVDRPAFLPHDEIEVPLPEGGLTRPEGVTYYPPGASEGAHG